VPDGRYAEFNQWLVANVYTRLCVEPERATVNVVWFQDEV
jgi:hypothetical protein